MVGCAIGDAAEGDDVGDVVGLELALGVRLGAGEHCESRGSELAPMVY